MHVKGDGNQAHPASLERRDHFSLWSVLSSRDCSWCWHRLGANKIWAVMYLMMEEEVHPPPNQAPSPKCNTLHSVGSMSVPLQRLQNNWRYREHYVHNVQILKWLLCSVIETKVDDDRVIGLQHQAFLCFCFSLFCQCCDWEQVL